MMRVLPSNRSCQGSGVRSAGGAASRGQCTARQGMSSEIIHIAFNQDMQTYTGQAYRVVMANRLCGIAQVRPVDDGQLVAGFSSCLNRLNATAGMGFARIAQVG